MIGNDIVDLSVASGTTRWNNQRFIEKVFTNNEQELIWESNDPFRTIWTLWSMKESAYKIHLRCHSRRFFAPRRLSCQLLASGQGIVTLGKEKYITSSFINENCIYTIAVENHQKIQKRVQSKYFFVDEASYSCQHATCYRKMICDLSESFNTPGQYFSIQKDHLGIPFLFLKDIQLPVQLSITHHGLFGAYAWVKV
jgi:phosphopantetheinyl transferase (holo-ACP synthase)